MPKNPSASIIGGLDRCDDEEMKLKEAERVGTGIDCRLQMVEKATR